MIKHLYIHIPFCESICSYCDFNKRVSSKDIQYQYLLKLEEEIEEYKEYYKDLETIFIGGGTPTAFIYLEELLKTLKKYINLEKIKEFTIEATPGTVSNFIPIFPKYFINRVSIGVESLNPKTLKYINRQIYTIKDLNNIILKLKNVCIDNINMDFIKGLPFETNMSINKTLLFIKNSGLTHVSYYDLIVEEKTKLFKDLSDFIITLPSESKLIKMDNMINKKLFKYGYKRYEVSNYSKDGFDSIHNSSYWTLEDYLGIGLGSHSLIDFRRYFNTTNLKEYLNISDFKKSRIEEDFNLKSEYLILGFRLKKGIDLNEYKNKFNSDLLKEYDLSKYLELKILEIKEYRIYFTDKGFNVMNQVLKEFL